MDGIILMALFDGINGGHYWTALMDGINGLHSLIDGIDGQH
jgi:hypothetical protein